MHFQPLPILSGGTIWGLMATIDTAEAYVPLTELRRALMTSGVCCALGLIATVLTARRITRCDYRLTSAVDGLASSEVFQHVESNRDDEFRSTGDVVQFDGEAAV